MLTISGDIELSPGITILLLLLVFPKFFLLKFYNAKHIYDIICLTETYLYSSNPQDDTRLNIVSRQFFRSVSACDLKGSPTGSFYSKKKKDLYYHFIDHQINPSTNFMISLKLYERCTFSQNLHTKKVDEILVFNAVFLFFSRTTLVGLNY